jgi:hypothetical protein
MAKVKTKAIEEKEVIKPQYPDILASSHLLALETMSRDIDMAKLKMNVEEQTLKNLSLELQLLTNKIEKQKVILQNKSSEYETVKKKFQNYKKELWPQYGFSEHDGLGYDPVTGKIVK